MYCSKCLRAAHLDWGMYEDLKMYKVPRIRYKGPMGEVKEWDILCEDCVQDYLEEEYRVKEEES